MGGKDRGVIHVLTEFDIEWEPAADFEAKADDHSKTMHREEFEAYTNAACFSSTFASPTTHSYLAEQVQSSHP